MGHNGVAAINSPRSRTDRLIYWVLGIFQTLWTWITSSFQTCRESTIESQNHMDLASQPTPSAQSSKKKRIIPVSFMRHNEVRPSCEDANHEITQSTICLLPTQPSTTDVTSVTVTATTPTTITTSTTTNTFTGCIPSTVSSVASATPSATTCDTATDTSTEYISSKASPITSAISSVSTATTSETPNTSAECILTTISPATSPIPSASSATTSDITSNTLAGCISSTVSPITSATSNATTVISSNKTSDTTNNVTTTPNIPGTPPTPLSPTTQSVFDTPDMFNCRLVKLCKGVCCKQMYQVYQWGNKKEPGAPLDIYLLKDKCLSRQDFAKRFTKFDKEKMKSDPDGTAFDITLLYKIFPYACEDMVHITDPVWTTKGDTLEYHLFFIKKFRNDLMHEDSVYSKSGFLDKFQEIRSTLIKMTEAAGDRFLIDPNVVKKAISDMNEEINRMRDDSLTAKDIQSYKDSLLFDGLVEQMKTSGKEELKRAYENAKTSYVNPTTFIAGSDIHIDVGVVFTTLKLTHGGKESKDIDIQYDELLDDISLQTDPSNSTADKILLIEGVAGAGKTTLTKLLISQWCSGNSVFKGLDAFDLLILMECRNPMISSLRELLDSAIPRTTEQIQKDDILPIFKRQRALIIVDGLDETNKSSISLLSEILHTKKKTNLQIIVFSRPEKVQDFYKMVKNDYEISHVSLGDIPFTMREQFVTKYHEELRNQGISRQKTAGLICYLRSAGCCLHHLWGLPLYLVNLTMLWSIAPERVAKIKSSTELYIEILGLCIEKLTDRVKTKEVIGNASCGVDTKTRILKFLWNLAKVSLESLRDDNVIIGNESSTRLIKVCDNLDLPWDETIGAFLVQKSDWTGTTLLHLVSFPHKGQLELFAALFLHHVLVGGSFENDDSKTKDIQKALHTKGYPPVQIKQVIEILRQDEELILPKNAQEALEFTELSETDAAANLMSTSASEPAAETHHNGTNPPLLTQTSTLSEIDCSQITEQKAGPCKDSSGISVFMDKVGKIIPKGNKTKRGARRLVHVLEDIHNDKLENLKLTKFQNTFIHLLGLVCMSGKETSETVIQILRLIHMSGERNTKAWLNTLSTVKSDKTAVSFITQKIPCILYQAVFDIEDAQVDGALTLFKLKNPKYISIRITADPNIPSLLELLDLILSKECQVDQLRFDGAFRRHVDVSQEIANVTCQILQRCQVQEYHGRASWLPSQVDLPVLQKVCLSVFDEDDLAKVIDLTKRTPKLKNILLHLSANSPVDLLPLLPKLKGNAYPKLIVSGINDDQVGWAADLAIALQGPHTVEFASLRIAESTITREGCEKWMEKLGSRRVRTGWVEVSSENLTKSDTKGLRRVSLGVLNAPIYLWSREKIWHHL